MKKLLLTLALVAITAWAHGQGSVGFLNGPTAVHRLKNSDGSLGTLSVDINSRLNYGIFIGSSADNLSLLPIGGVATGSTTAAGRMVGVPAVFLLPNTNPGDVVFARVRAWDSAFGNDWQTASRNVGSYYGETDVRQLEPLGPASGPGTVIWQGATGASANRFFAMQIAQVVPEPSTIALAVLGVGSLLLFRRRK